MDPVTLMIGPIADLLGETLGFGRDIFGEVTSQRHKVLDGNEQRMNNEAKNRAIRNAAIAILVMAVIFIVYKKYSK